jgi:hypothetical protein
MIRTPENTIIKRRKYRTKRPKPKPRAGNLDWLERSKLASRKPAPITLPKLRFMGNMVQLAATSAGGSDDEGGA